ncbi:hypothetical protein ABZ923_33625 [Streptomyces sp. NPDC046881]|uniref:hypothetical protein n=1 Tax=Streptomyces sp. NPDC046881 TaxID=3155374 RepID=UPI0033DCC455
MSRPARHLPRVRALFLTAFTASVLAACSSGPQTTPADEPTPAQTPTPALTPANPATPTTHSALTADPSYIANNVIYWWDSGGKGKLVNLISTAVDVQDLQTSNDWAYDFGPFFNTLDRVREYGPIPDVKTQATWSAALKHLQDGAGDILNATRLDGTQSQSPSEAAQETQGWKEFDEGIKYLKATQTRLHRTFGLTLPNDPWKEDLP